MDVGSTWTGAVLLLAGTLLVGGCGQEGSYRLHWTIGCEVEEGVACEVSSPASCSQVGLDAVEVFTERGMDQTRALFRCYSLIFGPVGEGPELEPGAITLHVYGLSPGSQHIVGPVSTQVTIPETGYENVQINIPRPSPCNDGMDNDEDGLVDRLDPGCAVSQGTQE